MTDFAKIAPYYDLMTNFSNRLVNDFGVIKNIIKKFEIETALDAGCGSGVHSIIMAKNGIDVTGLDASEEMLELAHKNALREGVEFPLLHEYFETMPNEWTGLYDGVFCLANSLVGVETGERLALSMKSFQRVLKPGGVAIIQLLNFIKFRRKEQRIIKVSTQDNLTFVRFFDFEEKEVRLNVLIIEHEMGEAKHRFISEKILPINTDVMEVSSRIAGFSSIEFYSDLSLTDPYETKSPNLVVVATK